MEVEDVPLDDKAKRMRDLLSSFYAPDPSSVSSPSNQASLDAINTTSFDPDQYMNLLVHFLFSSPLIQTSVIYIYTHTHTHTYIQVSLIDSLISSFLGYNLENVIRLGQWITIRALIGMCKDNCCFFISNTGNCSYSVGRLLVMSFLGATNLGYNVCFEVRVFSFLNCCLFLSNIGNGVYNVGGNWKIGDGILGATNLKVYKLYFEVRVFNLLNWAGAKVEFGGPSSEACWNGSWDKESWHWLANASLWKL